MQEGVEALRLTASFGGVALRVDGREQALVIWLVQGWEWLSSFVVLKEVEEARRCSLVTDTESSSSFSRRRV